MPPFAWTTVYVVVDIASVGRLAGIGVEYRLVKFATVRHSGVAAIRVGVTRDRTFAADAMRIAVSAGIAEAAVAAFGIAAVVVATTSSICSRCRGRLSLGIAAVATVAACASISTITALATLATWCAGSAVSGASWG